MPRAALLGMIVLPALLCEAGAGEGEGARWLAGAYSFSDELGGFRIRAVSGVGTKDDPIVVEQEFEAATPATLTIRASYLVQPFSLLGPLSFAEYSRDFEPYDRLLYRGGHVDPLETAGFDFLITDFTPKSVFYLRQDPRIPSS